MGGAWLFTLLVFNLIRPLPILSIPGVELFSGGMVKDGHYVYMDQLKALDSKKAWTRAIISWDVYTQLILEQ